MAVSPIPDPDSRRVADDLTGELIGRFVVQGRLGQGGMGEVYLAEDTALRRRVAIKRVPPRLHPTPATYQQFFSEAERASQLSNQHIASIYDVLQTGDDVLLVMEYVEGQTLRSRLEKGPLSPSEFLDVALQIADALRAAHSRGVLHCDIKPENIMVKEDGEIKVLDFGISRCPHQQDISTAQTAPTLTATLHNLSGTPAYMAPEVLLQKRPDIRSDIFSLGVVFYELLSGRNPFVADSVIATADRILHENPRPVCDSNPQVRPELSRIVHKMLAKTPRDRYASATELLADLRGFQSGTAIPTQSFRFEHLLRKLAPALALVLVLIAAAALIAYRPDIWKGNSASAIPARKQLAVLPFATPDANNRAFSDGLAETLTAKLSQLSDDYPVEVIPPSEARAQGVETVEEAQKALGVNLVLTGMLRRSGDMIRVTYALMDAKTRRQLRGDTITSEMSNPFAVEDRIVDGILGSMEIALAPDDRHAIAARGTKEPQAYDYYLQGVGYLQDFHKSENLDSAMTVFRRALDRDPKYALAWAGIGQTAWFKYDLARDPAWLNTARDACQRAVSLDDNVAGPHTCLGVVHNGTGHYEDAVNEFRKALELEPSSQSAHLGLAHAYQQLNRLAEAEGTYRRAIEVRPSYWGGYDKLGVFYYNHARYPEALAMFQKVVDLTPDNFRGYSNLGGIYLTLDQYDKAIPMLEKSVAIRPDADAYSNLATAYFYQRRFEDAARTYEHSVKLNPAQYLPWANLAEAYHWIPARRAEADRTYRKAIEIVRQEIRTNPRNAKVLGDLAVYYAMTGQVEAARTTLSKAFKHAASNDVDVLYSAAIVYKQSGDTDRAISYLEQSVSAGFSRNRIRDNPLFDDLGANARLRALMRH
ncbi:MAG TPA: tetratricopeptide repeat protein [Terriglobales bacterium]|nr:tetratricopeptide repeat protein [Terriglobales bacterium]